MQSAAAGFKVMTSLHSFTNGQSVRHFHRSQAKVSNRQLMQYAPGLVAGLLGGQAR